MWPFPKKLFEWREPREFRRIQYAVENASRRWWHLPALAVGNGIALIAVSCLARLVPNRQVPPFHLAVPLALSAGIFLVYFLAAVYRYAPSTVLIRRHCMVRIRGDRPIQWLFNQFESFCVAAGDGFSILSLNKKNGRTLLIGVPREVDMQSLSDYLRSVGVPQFVPSEPRPPLQG